MRILLVSILSLSLFGVVSCGEQMASSGGINDLSTDGTGSSDKPTNEEKKEFLEAKRYGVNVSHKSIQVMALNEKTAVIRTTVNVAGADQFFTLTPTSLGPDEVASFDRSVNGAQLEIILHRVQKDAQSVPVIGVEYRVSRAGAGGRAYIASQFLRLRGDKLNSSQIVTKQKFEYPSKTNLLQWIRD